MSGFRALRIGRPNKRGISLAWQVEVVGEPAFAGEQAAIFLALNRLADMTKEFLPDQLQLGRERGGMALRLSERVGQNGQRRS